MSPADFCWIFSEPVKIQAPNIVNVVQVGTVRFLALLKGMIDGMSSWIDQCMSLLAIFETL